MNIEKTEKSSEDLEKTMTENHMDFFDNNTQKAKITDLGKFAKEST